MLPALNFYRGDDVLLIRERPGLAQARHGQPTLVEPRYETVILHRGGTSGQVAELLIKTDVRSDGPVPPEERDGKLFSVPLEGDPPTGRLAFRVTDLDLDVSLRRDSLMLDVRTGRPTLAVQGGTLSRLEQEMRAELGGRFQYPYLRDLDRALMKFSGDRVFRFNLDLKPSMPYNRRDDGSTGTDR